MQQPQETVGWRTSGYVIDSCMITSQWKLLILQSSFFQSYFRDLWNVFDCFVVLGSVLDIILMHVPVSIFIFMLDDSG